MPYGYFTSEGYMGRVHQKMILFASERDYLDYIDDKEVRHIEEKNDWVNAY